jgi:hypothetical protein
MKSLARQIPGHIKEISMKYIVNCPLGTNITDEARALYGRLAALLLERFNEVTCKFELRSEELAFKPASMPNWMKNYKSEYFGVFTFEFKGYSAYIDGALTDLAEDFGLDYVEWTQDGSQYRKDSATAFAAAFERAYPEAA